MRSRTRIILNILLAAGSIGSWLVMVFSGGGMLTDSGLPSLKYFTVLSNIFEGIASIIWIAAGKKAEEKTEKLKYIAAVSVALTFMTVMLFLGPLYGYRAMLSGVNLPLHLLVPVAALAECIFLSDALYTSRDNLLAVVPMLLYGTWYIMNNLINGIGAWPDTNDWYGFLNWGWPPGLMIFAGLCLITWLVGAALRRVNAMYDLRTINSAKR